jgi:alpha-D-xyloside xylohydrolase
VAPSPPGGPVDYGRDLFQVFTDTGGPNEIWSFGPQVESLLTPMAHLRESLRPHVRQAMQDWQAQGIPPMRPLAFDHPGDPASDAPEQYLFGRGLLVAPVTRPGATSRPVHLPVGADWLCPWTGTRHPGGSRPTLSTPLGRPCVLVRDDAAAPTLIATMATAMGPTA